MQIKQYYFSTINQRTTGQKTIVVDKLKYTEISHLFCKRVKILKYLTHLN